MFGVLAFPALRANGEVVFQEVVLVANDLAPCPGQPEVDPALLALAESARPEPVGS